MGAVKSTLPTLRIRNGIDGAEMVLPCRARLEVRFRRSLRVGAWNVIGIVEDYRLHHLLWKEKQIEWCRWRRDGLAVARSGVMAVCTSITNYNDDGHCEGRAAGFISRL